MSSRPDYDGPPHWRAASQCSNGDCVEVALLCVDTVGVRDNKNPDSPILTFSSDEWSAFIRRVRAGY